MPPPARTPLTAILPKPASNIAGGSPDSGPAMEGDPSGIGAAGAAGAADASAGLPSAGGVCAIETEARARQAIKTLRPWKKRPNMFHLSFFRADIRAQKKTPRSTNDGLQLDV